MSAASYVVAALVAGTVALLIPAPARTVSSIAREPVQARAPDASSLRQLRPLLALVGGAGGWALVGGRFGALAGIVAAMVVWVVLGRSEPPSVVRRREQLVADLPTAVDLLANCLDAGAAPEAALPTVADALGGPVGEELRAIHHRLALGVDPATVWRGVAAHPQLGRFGRAIGRAHDTGASVGAAVHRLSEDLRERAWAEIEARARSIEVKSAAPLGLCLLPAFVLLGVVPMIVGVFRSMRLFE